MTHTRITIALVFVGLTAVGAGVIVVTSQVSGGTALQTLSQDMMLRVAEQTEAEACRYLQAGVGGVRQLREAVERGVLDPGDLDAVAAQFGILLSTHHEFEMLNYGMPNGDFLMVKRMPDGTLSIKTIIRQDGVASSRWQHQDGVFAGQDAYKDRAQPAAEAYDPRVREWYQAARDRDQLIWVEPYIFYSDQQPGVACAVPIHDVTGTFRGVISADIGIAQLSSFLGELQERVAGRALLMSRQGGLIAYPSTPAAPFSLARSHITADGRSKVVLKLARDAPGEMGAAVSELSRPEGMHVYSQPFTFEATGKPYLAVFEGFPPETGLDWVAGVVADQDEFVAPLRRSRVITLAISLVCLFLVIAIAIGLTAFTMRQEVRTRLESDRLKDRFIANVSHELRTPLTSIHGSLALLSAGVVGELPAQTKKLIDISLRNSKHLGALVEDLLDMSRVFEGRLELVYEDIVVSELFDRVVVGMHALAGSREIELTVECTEHLTVEADEKRLIQVLHNLIGNAIKFSPSKSRILVHAIALPEQNLVQISVQDEGPGVPAELQERLFHRFYQAQENKERASGAGLGLSIAQEILTAHAGHIWVESEPGQGATFKFQLPKERSRRRTTMFRMIPLAPTPRPGSGKQATYHGS